MTTRPVSTTEHFAIVHGEACSLSPEGITEFSDEQKAFTQHNECTLENPGGCVLKRVIECELRTSNHVVILPDTDRWLLRFLHDRLINVHKESPNLGYMHKLRSIIAAVPLNQNKNDTVSCRDIRAELDEEER